MAGSTIGVTTPSVPRCGLDDATTTNTGTFPSQSSDNWVQCDRCGQWRRVSEAVVEALEDDSNWYCEDNSDELHNSCNVPQEMTNADIDKGRMLESLENERLRRKRRPAVWQLVR
jgi:hypothetical protein